MSNPTNLRNCLHQVSWNIKLYKDFIDKGALSQDIGFKGRGCTRKLSQVAQMVKNLPTMQETLGSIPGSGRSPGVGNDSIVDWEMLWPEEPVR